MEKMSDFATHPITAVSTTGSVVTANFSGFGVPDFINYATAVYLALLVIHKLYVMYKEFRSVKPNEHSE